MKTFKEIQLGDIIYELDLSLNARMYKVTRWESNGKLTTIYFERENGEEDNFNVNVEFENDKYMLHYFRCCYCTNKETMLNEARIMYEAKKRAMNRIETNYNNLIKQYEDEK